MASNSIVNGRPIQGKVAGILTERELTINIGTKSGVSQGMKFKVLAREPIRVKDPDTASELGTVDREKVRVVATEVQEKFSICRTFRKRTTGVSNFAAIGAILSGMNSYREVPETLKVEDASLPQPLSEEESYVKVGDRVVQLLEDEERE